MDAQLRRGILEVCVLKALQSQDSYGYRIIKDVSPYVVISESTLYPILRRLEGAGCLSTYTMEHNSRLRKYYSITPRGVERISAFLTTFPLVTYEPAIVPTFGTLNVSLTVA